MGMYYAWAAEKIKTLEKHHCWSWSTVVGSTSPSQIIYPPNGFDCWKNMLEYTYGVLVGMPLS